MSVQIEAEYLGSEPKGNVLYLKIRIKLGVSAPQSPVFIMIPKLRYEAYLYTCDNEATSCNPVSQNCIYCGELNWLTVPCSSCSQEVELPIILDKELIDRLVSIVEDNKRPTFQVTFTTDPYVIPPHVMASVPLPNANAIVATVLNLNMPVLIKGNLGDGRPFIVLSSDDVKHILNSIKYVERVKIEVEVKLPETTEGLPEPLIDAIKALKAAFNDINNLDFANAIIKCRSAIEHITKHEKRGDENVRVIKNEVKDAILSKYDGVVKDFYKGVLDDILEVTIRKTYTMMSRFVHPDSSKVEFYPRMDDAIYICRQTLGIIDCLVELSQAYSYWVNACASAA